MKRILIIDDDIYIGNMEEEILSKEGYEVLRAYSGTEALLVLSRQKPDLILLDLMLPGLSGEEVLPNISNLRKKLKDAGNKDYIEAVWGIGFKMKEQ